MSAMTLAARAQSPAIRADEVRGVAAAACQVEAALLAPLDASRGASGAYFQAINPPAGMPALEKLRWSLERWPSEAMLQTLQRDLERLVTAGPDDRQNRVLVALCADSFRPSRDGLSGGMIEVLLHDLRDGGFPPAVVAAALKRIRGSARYFPSIAEVLEACREAARRLETSVASARRIEAERRSIVSALAGAVSAPELVNGQ